MTHRNPRSILAAVLALTVPASAFSARRVGDTPGATMANDSFYSLKTSTLAGKPADLAQFAGQVTLVVNVASECGFTPQYKGLEALHEELKAKGFSVLGFPSNDFGGQEPGSPEQIQTFCQKNYGVTFPMFGKLVTKTGPEQSPIYAYLGKTGNLPNWNFCKYLVGKDGKVIAFFPSKVTPESKDLKDAIEAALAK
jgi:glutathione peroxidase